MFLNILANCIETFLFFVFLWNVFGISRVGRVFCGALGIVCMQTGFSLLKIDTSIAFMATVIVFIFVGTVVFRGKTSEKVFWSCLYLTFVSIIKYITYMLFAFLSWKFGFSGLDLKEYITAGIYLFVAGISICVFGRKKKTEICLPFKYQLYMTGAVVAGVGITGRLSDMMMDSGTKNGEETKWILWFSCVVIYCMLIAMLFFAYKTGEFFEKSRIADAQKKQYENIDNALSELRMWRHDYKNNLLVLSHMLKAKKFKEAEQLTEQLGCAVDDGKTIVNSGNIIVDYLITDKYMLAKKKKIKVQYEIFLPKGYKVNSLEFIGILGNLFDNAIEAAEKVEEKKRFIHVIIKPCRKMLGICIKNAANGVYIWEKGKLNTSKTGIEHGYGLRRVEKLVNQLKGALEYQIKSGEFQTMITLPLDTDERGDYEYQSWDSGE